MKFEEIPDYIDSLDIFTKAHWWVDYMVRMQSLRHSIWFDIDFYNSYEFKSKNQVESSKSYALWGNTNITPFHDWVDRKLNIKVTDNGENWQQNGFAQRIRTDYFGIYDYYIKFILN